MTKRTHWIGIVVGFLMFGCSGPLPQQGVEEEPYKIVHAPEKVPFFKKIEQQAYVEAVEGILVDETNDVLYVFSSASGGMNPDGRYALCQYAFQAGELLMVEEHCDFVQTEKEQLQRIEALLKLAQFKWIGPRRLPVLNEHQMATMQAVGPCKMAAVLDHTTRINYLAVAHKSKETCFLIDFGTTGSPVEDVRWIELRDQMGCSRPLISIFDEQEHSNWILVEVVK